WSEFFLCAEGDPIRVLRTRLIVCHCPLVNVFLNNQVLHCIIHILLVIEVERVAIILPVLSFVQREQTDLCWAELDSASSVVGWGVDHTQCQTQQRTHQAPLFFRLVNWPHEHERDTLVLPLRTLYSQNRRHRGRISLSSCHS